MRNPFDFSGLWIPLITPFHGGAVDHAALSRLAKHLAGQGARGLVACGSTGEAAALDEGEQLAVLHTMLGACGDLPVVMGLSGYHLPKTLDWIDSLNDRASDPRLVGLLVPAPHHIRPSQGGLLHWFQAIADRARPQVIVYDIPDRTGVQIEQTTLLELAGHPNIKAVKDCGRDLCKTQAVLADGRLQVLCGEDSQLFSSLALGAAGSITASAHLHTQAFADLIRAMREGSLIQARSGWRDLSPVVDAMFREPNPACIKAGLAEQGWIQNELRAPMMAAVSTAGDRGKECDFGRGLQGR